eukprot:PITA_36600
MLHMFVMQQRHKWEDYLHLVDFPYNNGHHESLGMSPFEVLYGRRYRVPIDWNSLVNKLVFGPDMLAEMEEMIKKVRENLRGAQDRQKMYANKNMTYREFQLGDHVYLRVNPQKSSLQWRGCAKLAPQYCGPFQVLEQIGSVAYNHALPSHIQVEPKGDFLAESLHILIQRETTLRKRTITQVKVQWKHFGPDEVIWEMKNLCRKPI